MDIKNKYIDTFFKDLTSEDKDEIYFHKYMWHAFSYEKVDALEGSKAIEELRKHKNNDVYIIFQRGEKILQEKDITYEQIYHNVLSDTWDTDCYIIDKEFKWTFVLTHETIDDDLDAMYETCGRIPEDTIVDVTDKDFVIGPFYLKK